MKSKYLFDDLRAGLVVFLVALPLCTGIAHLQGAPPLSGIIAGVFGGIIVGLISNSSLSVSGPAAGLTSVMIAAMAAIGDFHLLLCSVIIAGVIQIIFGLLRFGVVAYIFPSATIRGMLFGIGIILIIKEIPHFTGYDGDPEGDFGFFQPDKENTITEIFHAFKFFSWPAIVIGMAALITLIIWNSPRMKKQKFTAFIPGPLVAVAIGILLQIIFNKTGGMWIIKDEHLLDLREVEHSKSWNNILFFPDFSGFNLAVVWKYGFIIAAVCTVETLINIEAIDKLDSKKRITNTNRELFAQGAGNLVCGFAGGIPITSVIVRSSANLNAGAQTKYSTVFHGLFLAMGILLAMPLIEQIPLAALAAILLYTGYKLASVYIFINSWKEGYKYFIPFIVTIIIMLFTDLLIGVACGIVVSLVFIIIENIQIPFRTGYDSINGKTHVLVETAEHITFANKIRFVNLLNTVPNDSVLVIDARKTKFMDRDILHLLEDFEFRAKNRNINYSLLKK